MASTLQQLILSGSLDRNRPTEAVERATATRLDEAASRTSTARQQQVIDLAPEAAALDAERVEIARQSAANADIDTQIKVKEFLREQSDADLIEGITTAKQFDAIVDQRGLEAFIALNPVDGKSLQGIRFGDDSFLNQKQQSQLLISGARDIQDDKALTKIAEINADLNADRITLEQANAAIRKETAVTKGTRFTFNPDTNEFEFSQGGFEGDQIIPGTSTTSKIEQAILSNQERLERIDTLLGGFDPRFLEVGSRLSAKASELKEKFGLGTLSPKEKRELEEISLFRRDAIASLNTELKEASGTAVSASESGRLLAQLPNPGTGLFDGDSATVFASKMNGVVRDLKRAQARLFHARTKGLNFSDIPLPNIDAIIDRRGQELLDLGLSNEAVKVRLKKEFGI